MPPRRAHRARPLARVVPVALGVLAACGPQPIANEQVYRTPHVTLHADPAIPMCEGALLEGERFVVATAAYLGVPPPQVDAHLYHVRPGAIPGCEGSGGCTFGRTILTDQWPHRHELVHAVTAGLGRPPAFLNEGLAETLGPESTATYPAYTLNAPWRGFPLEDTLTSLAFRADADAHGIRGYYASADFLRYVIDRFGAGALGAWFASVTYLADPLTVREQFARITRTSLEDALAGWRASPYDPRRAPPQMTAPLECSDAVGPTVTASASGPDVFDADRTLTRCATNRFVFDDAGYARDSFDAPADGVYQVTFGDATPTDHVLARCGDSLESRVVTAQSTVVDAAAGRYYLAIRDTFRLSPPPAVFHWTARSLGAPPSRCADAPALAVGRPGTIVRYATTPTRWRGRVGDPSGGGTLAATWLRVDLDRVRGVTIAPTFTQPLSLVRVCSGCDTTARCEMSTGRTGFSFVPSGAGPVFIELGTAVNAPPTEVAITVN